MIKCLKKLKIRAIPLAAAFAAAAAIGVTYAWQTWDLEMKNVLTAHNTEVKIVEDFDPASGNKKVQFENLGTSSVFLRVSYTEFWEIEGEAWNSESEGTGNIPSDIKGYFPSTILSNTVEGEKVAEKYCNDKMWSPKSGGQEWNDSEMWTDGGDGWFYYNKILKSGDITEPVLTHVIFNKKWVEPERDEEGKPVGENAELQLQYEKAHYQLYFKAEVVQCSDGSNTLNSPEVNKNATQELFSKIATVEEDGISVSWQAMGGEGNEAGE